jgi:hypothetical protein
MTLGAFAFLNPWLLAALATLPLIYWLLRTIPPRPRQVEFPPTRILVGLENQEKTPAKTPWWLLLIRLLAAALVILALAEPILNPSQEQALKGTGPVVIAIDNGWAGAPRWSERTAAAEHLITEAQSQSRAVVILDTASAAKARTVRLEAPAEARSTLGGLQPQPFAPDRKATLAALQAALAKGAPGAPSIVWLSDGIDYDGSARAFADGLEALSTGGMFAAIEDAPGHEALGLSAGVGVNGKLTARVLRADGPAREGMIYALSARDQRLGETPFRFGASETAKDLSFELPLELRNQVTRIEIAGEHSAGAVNLLDARSQWQRVGLISGESQEQAQPLLAPLYYIEKAIKPFAEIVHPKDQNLALGIDAILKQNASVLMLADIGTLSGELKERVEDWVKRGGVLVRFAGPRLEKGGDDLLPVALRLGGRTLGGALSWSTPQPLAPFDDSGLFAGLSVPADVTVSRQVLADPAQLTPEVKVWARLHDGTPLVTSAKRGAGQVVLFHVTANSDWSNLPISGLFVEMLHRVTALGGLSGTVAGGEGDATVAGQTGDQKSIDALAPVQTLDGFGALRRPPPTAEAIPAAEIAEITPSLDHPPGYYGPQASPRSVNVLNAKSALAAMPPLPLGTERRAYESRAAVPLMPWLLAAALALIFADIIAVLLLLGGGLGLRGLGGSRPAHTAAALLFVATLGLAAAPPPAHAQSPAAIPDNVQRNLEDAIAQRATEKVTLGYVLTGNEQADQTSKLGLAGLCRVLSVRTAVEPADPIGVDIVKDEIAFFPVLYWPVLESAKQLPEPTLAKIDAFMKQGGMIVFDTRDYGTGRPAGSPLESRSGPALQRLLGSLDLPRLEPVPEEHVLTKSFYLLRSFPGRWDGGQLWVEADGGSDDGSRKARRADGVSSILITSNDLAAAWALDSSGRPIYPVVPGGENQREMAFRTGINIVMHALTGNYKADQVHVPALLERLGQ